MCICNRPENQESQALLMMPGFFVNKFLRAIDLAEEKLGKSPNVMQIYVVLADDFGSPVKNIYEAAGVVFSLLREEIIYCDENAEYFSRTKSETMLSYSDFFSKNFGKDQYQCMKGGEIVAKRARTINLTYLLNILRSKDYGVLESQKWMFDGEHRFLHGDPIK